MNASHGQAHCTHLISGSAVKPGQTIHWDHGIISSTEAGPAPSGPRLLVMPVLVNAHDHGRAVRTSAVGAAGKPLEAWLQYLALFPAVDPYLAAAVSLGNSALGGAGVVMIHYTRAQGFTDLPTEVAAVARAARDVGVRVGFAVSMKDRNPVGYGPADGLLSGLPAGARDEIVGRYFRTPLAPAEQVALVDAVADAAGTAEFNVQYGPNGVQWCSDALLETIAEASAVTGRRIHMHLFETRYQRAYLDQLYSGDVVRHLDRIGLLSPRLSLAHCVWARPDELELLAERGVTIVTNPSSNLHLQSGIAPVRTMVECGCHVALGVDAHAFDDDDDTVREMRLAHLLHAGTGFSATSPLRMLSTTIENGRRSVCNTSGGRIEKDAPADLLLLDWDRLTEDALRDDLDPVDIFISGATAAHIRKVIVAGRTIVEDRRVLGIDLAAARREILTHMRASMRGMRGLETALPALDRAIAHEMQQAFGCG